ncbi:MAG TPA: division plane positioning ATPase MipZ [Xanthobacteraceae bacterium]|nr:division plane positioning ATPase MipZ [Xanthobacteraceae bacterium]
MRTNSPKRGGAGPRVVVIGNHKGGCGKSTVAMHLIVSLLKEKRRVASFDLDLTQQTLTRYIENRVEWGRLHRVSLEVPDHCPIAEASVAAPHPDAADATVFTSTIAALPAGYDFVVIDTPSGENHLSLLAHALADTLITPINDSFVDLDVIGTMAPSSDFKPRRSRYAEMVAAASERRGLVSSRPTDWVVVRNRLPRLMSRNQRQVGEMLEMMAPELGFRTAHGLSDRVIYREFFPVGLTAFDPLDEKRLGLKTNLAHVMARAEVRDLMQDIGLLPSGEPLDFERRVNLIVGELKLPRSTLLGEPAKDTSPAAT